MSYDGNGNYTVPAGTQAVGGAVIDSTKYNALLTDLQTALTKALLRDGQSAALANIPMGSNKLTGLAAGSANGDSLRYEQLYVGGVTTVTNATNAASATSATNSTNAVNVTGTIASAVTAATQTAGDNSAKVATTAYVATAIAAIPSGVQLTQTSTTALSAQTVALFSSIPSWAKRIRVAIMSMSTTAAIAPLLQIGPSGGIETSGYVGTCFGVVNTGNPVTAISGSTGFYLTNVGLASNVCSGFIELTLLDSATNTWAASGNLSQTGGSIGGFAIAGHKAIAGTLTQLRLYLDGINTFDGGSVSVTYLG